MSSAYDRLVVIQRENSLLGSVSSLLGWDQETMMPEAATMLRADQSGALSGLLHQKRTDDEIGRLLGECEKNGFEAGSVEAANVREWRRDYERARKLPREHVEELARTRAISQAEWAKARAASDFSIFAPHLRKMLELTRKSAKYYGWPDDGEPYDALIEDYEPGARAKEIEAVFGPLRERLTSFIAEIAKAPNTPDDDIHRRVIPRKQQEAFVRFVASAIGFNFKRGRLDVSTHPFCSGIGPGDCRMTTRFHDDNVMDALSSTMHEAGHGIYEQNLADDRFGTPCGEAVSLGIHESQSRGWENFVGRSRPFWEWLLPHAKELMPEAFKEETIDSVYAAQNIVRPSFIRVEADETTYNLHIMLRFELERRLLRDELEVEEVPRVWNERFKEYLGIEVDRDSNGCLQDVHWSFGLIGYFPTYTLGNLYAAQFFDAAREAIPDLDDQFRRGEFHHLREWLTEEIHRHGRRYPAAELCERVTGKPLEAEPLLRHLESKLRPIYGI
ncbi:MAG: carboxypeptidase M32 [Phycisphaerales bacterium]